MDNYYLAIDIGASNGRHMLASLVEGRMVLEEVYRFPNAMVHKDGHHCWDVKRLFTEIINGLKKCKEIGKIPAYLGIDTWGVDYVLLDQQDQIIGDTYGYRDSRTAGMDQKVYEVVSEADLYARTGIQFQIFNTIYQLMAVKEQQPEDLNRAEALLMIPDYFHFLLTGVKKMEYTNATTGQLMNPQTYDWDYQLIEQLGFPRKLFQKVSMPGTLVGDFTPEIQGKVEFNCQVVLPATHDTGSAVLAVPTNEERFLYISSGTWSLMGIERPRADCSAASMKANFTNEGGYDHRFRYLKNIMGLWMIQSVKRELENQISFAELCDMAAKAQIQSIVDCNDDCFLAPASMIQAVQDYCAMTRQQVPQSTGELVAVIYNSLAQCYGRTVREIEAVTGQCYETIHVIGGGANAEYLNQLTVQSTGKKVMAGPTEATAIGNIIVQMIHAGEFAGLSEARKVVKESFEIQEYKNQEKKMTRKGFKMKLRQGMAAEYEKRHNELWPEMKAMIHEYGGSNYTIFLDQETNILYGSIEVEDEQRWAASAATDSCQKWWAFMADIMETNPDNSPVSSDLKEVFHLD